jgi:hypothetical protein
MKKVVLSVVLYAIAFALTFISVAPHNKFMLVAGVTLFSIVAGLLLSLTLLVWETGDTFKERMIKACSLGFPLAAASFILGYGYVIIQSLIRS